MKKGKTLLLTASIIILVATSCKTKSECPSYDEPSTKKEEEKGSKYKLILLKDGKRIGPGSKRKHKKAKHKLFKKKVVP